MLSTGGWFAGRHQLLSDCEEESFLQVTTLSRAEQGLHLGAAYVCQAALANHGQ